MYGSSPRVRGKRRHARRLRARLRIIPARAGQTAVVLWPVRACPDHPRACGANVMSSPFLVMRDGSSPRVRGKRGVECSAADAARIIPARAGQTSVMAASAVCRTDHPRACGANGGRGYDRHGQRGSSPRVRGKRWLVGSIASAVRIIPARAGQTAVGDTIGTGNVDHPRACGANGGWWGQLHLLYGSSPRVRGKLFADTDANRKRRIIPARAGQTRAVSRYRPSRPDHPRACGANCPPL